MRHRRCRGGCRGRRVAPPEANERSPRHCWRVRARPPFEEMTEERPFPTELCPATDLNENHRGRSRGGRRLSQPSLPSSDGGRAATRGAGDRRKRSAGRLVRARRAHALRRFRGAARRGVRSRSLRRCADGVALSSRSLGRGGRCRRERRRAWPGRLAASAASVRSGAARHRDLFRPPPKEGSEDPAAAGDAWNEKNTRSSYQPDSGKLRGFRVNSRPSERISPDSGGRAFQV